MSAPKLETTNLSSAESTDYEADNFEDAQDTPDNDNTSPYSITASTSSRSLTGDRRVSTTSVTTPKALRRPTLKSSPSTNDGNKLESESEYDTDRKSAITTDDDVVSVEGLGIDHGKAKGEEYEEAIGAPGPGLDKSSLLTSHRLSTRSMAEVDLAEEKEKDEIKAKEAEADKMSENTLSPVASATEKPQVPEKDSRPKHPSRLQGLSASSFTLPWASAQAPPPPPKTAPLPSPTPPPARKLTGPFSWLSRNSASNSSIKSPPLTGSGSFSDRRNTGASISTLASNVDPGLSRLDERGEDDRASLKGRDSLRDRFKMVRLREQAGVTVEAGSPDSEAGPGNMSVKSRKASMVLGVTSPDEKFPTPGLASVSSFPVNASLPPGTVSGLSTAPGDADAEVDWDLWQAVANTEPGEKPDVNQEELSAAIAKGIPQTIRGIIWQVLADSKADDLEDVYRELVARGTDKEKDTTATPISLASLNGLTNGRAKDSVTSSQSSIHSETSTPATSSTPTLGTATSPTPSNDADADSLSRTQSETASTPTKKRERSKSEAAALTKLEKAIKRDMGSRTSYSKYAVSKELQEGLFGVCKAYALFDKGVGYAQGMNFIVMPLLFNMDDHEAFCLLVKLMSKFGLRELFVQDMPGLHLHLHQFERLLEDVDPALACHLYRRGVTPQLYATPWFLTLFAYRFPLQLVLRIYDFILSEGLSSAILRFGIGILTRNREALLGMDDMASLTTYLKEKLFDVYIDQAPSATSILESGFFGSSAGTDKEVYRADLMVADATSVKITATQIATYTADWEEKTRLAKERETELETLRHTVATQANKIRSLEERAEQSDTEHVHLASDLVRLKLENESLTDTNESLTIQVNELRKLVQDQPAEIEASLRTEMDRIMKRNGEVQNENRVLAEQLEEMEQDFVKTKMEYAELRGETDELRRKWTDLRRALD